MEGLVFDIKRFAVHDGPGIRTTVFLKGCPLRCWWCHNPESQCVKSETDVKRILLDGFQHEKKEELGKRMTLAQVMEVLDKDAVFYDESGGGITLSGGEPLLQADFCIEILRACHERGYHTALDTCGYAKAETIKAVAEYVDLFLYDLKHANNDQHQKFTGVELTLILENLKLLVELKKEIIIRIPVIPGINDSREDAVKFISIINGIGGIHEVHLLPFHATAASKYKRLGKENKLAGLKNMEKSDLLPMAEIFEKSGFEVKIGG